MDFHAISGSGKLYDGRRKCLLWCNQDVSMSFTVRMCHTSHFVWNCGRPRASSFRWIHEGWWWDIGCHAGFLVGCVTTRLVESYWSFREVGTAPRLLSAFSRVVLRTSNKYRRSRTARVVYHSLELRRPSLSLERSTKICSCGLFIMQ